MSATLPHPCDARRAARPDGITPGALLLGCSSPRRRRGLALLRAKPRKRDLDGVREVLERAADHGARSYPGIEIGIETNRPLDTASVVCHIRACHSLWQPTETLIASDSFRGDKRLSASRTATMPDRHPQRKRRPARAAEARILVVALVPLHAYRVLEREGWLHEGPAAWALQEEAPR